MTNTKRTVKNKTKKGSTVTATVTKAEFNKKGGTELTTDKKFQYLYNRLQTAKRLDGYGYNYLKNSYIEPIFKNISAKKLEELDKHITAINKFVYIVEGVIYNIEHPENNKMIKELVMENAKLKEQLEKVAKTKTTKKSTKIAKETN